MASVTNIPDYLDCSVIICNQLLLLIFKLLYNFLEPLFCSELLLAVLFCQRGNGCLKFSYDLKRKQHAKSLFSNRHVLGMFLCLVRAWHWHIAAQTKYSQLTHCTLASRKCHTKKRKIARLQITKPAEHKVFGRVFHYGIPKYLLMRTKHICDLQNIGSLQVSTALKWVWKICRKIPVYISYSYTFQLHWAHVHLLGWNAELQSSWKECTLLGSAAGPDWTPRTLQYSAYMIHSLLLKCTCCTIFLFKITVESRNYIKSFRLIYRMLCWQGSHHCTTWDSHWL